MKVRVQPSLFTHVILFFWSVVFYFAEFICSFKCQINYIKFMRSDVFYHRLIKLDFCFIKENNSKMSKLRLQAKAKTASAKKAAQLEAKKEAGSSEKAVRRI